MDISGGFDHVRREPVQLVVVVVLVVGVGLCLFAMLGLPSWYGTIASDPVLDRFEALFRSGYVALAVLILVWLELLWFVWRVFGDTERRARYQSIGQLRKRIAVWLGSLLACAATGLALVISFELNALLAVAASALVFGSAMFWLETRAAWSAGRVGPG